MRRALLAGGAALTLAALLAVAAMAPQWSAPLRFRDWGRLATDGEIVVGGNSTGAGGVFALNARTGALLWKSAARQQSGAAAIGEGLAFAEVGEAVRAFDLKTGREPSNALLRFALN